MLRAPCSRLHPTFNYKLGETIDSRLVKITNQVSFALGIETADNEARPTVITYRAYPGLLVILCNDPT